MISPIASGNSEFRHQRRAVQPSRRLLLENAGGLDCGMAAGSTLKRAIAV